MSKNIPAVERVGITTPNGIAENGHSANLEVSTRFVSHELASILQNEFLLPLGTTAKTLDQLEALFRQFSLELGKDVFSRADQARLRQIADLAVYVAADAANSCGCYHERGLTQHLPALLDMIQGGGAQ